MSGRELVPKEFWGPVDASIDWCEPNYATVPFLAETFNSVSSLSILYLGLIGLFRTRRLASKELRFTLAFGSLAVIGAGSVLFHGTMRRAAQLLDELPMLCSGSTRAIEFAIS
jgi:dihydroceramidase